MNAVDSMPFNHPPLLPLNSLHDQFWLSPRVLQPIIPKGGEGWLQPVKTTDSFPLHRKVVTFTERLLHLAMIMIMVGNWPVWQMLRRLSKVLHTFSATNPPMWLYSSHPLSEGHRLAALGRGHA